MNKDKHSKEVKCGFKKVEIPTYSPGAPMDLPMFFEKRPYQGATGRLYPLPFTDSLSEKKKEKEYDAAVLENEYIQVTVLPEVGGKILRGFDKIGKYDFIYHNSVIKPAMIGLAGPWISGGIEFNWPQHHRPTTFMPLEAVIEECPNGERTVWTGEVEPFNRTKAMAGITVCPGRSYIKTKVRIYNRTPFVQSFMWWANLAVPVNDNYRIIFPPDVEWVNDHDRRAVIGWPVAKGTYNTARPFDYGEGTDLSYYKSVKVPSSFMISQGQSDMDFVAGYDCGRKKGIVAYADHNIAPGKKLFTWGTGDFGNMWCSNLTDEDGPYVELMTGAYTDNQPDFSWIMPYETKTFEQYWYPIRDIGGVKNATTDAAINVELEGRHLLIGIQATGSFPSSHITVTCFGEKIWQDAVDLTPETSYIKRVRLDEDIKIEDLTVTLTDMDGKGLVSYCEPKRGTRKPIEPRKAVARPSEIETVDELFINGLHLEQYKQHNYDAIDYYSEALKRDPGDIRCNTAMGRLMLRNGSFLKAIDYLNTAISRITSRNEHPANLEAFYLKGLALRYLNRNQEAKDVFNRVIWHYSYRSAAYYELATIASQEGDSHLALKLLDLSLSTNADHLKALNLKAAILRNLGLASEALALAKETAEVDKLDIWSRLELMFSASQANDPDLSEKTRLEIDHIFSGKPENYLDAVCDYMHAGLYADAMSVLDLISKPYPLTHYYKGYCLSLMNGDPKPEYRLAEKCDALCFPSRLEEIGILSNAAETINDAARSHYYLGCLFYDRFRYNEAIEQWEASIRLDDTFAYAYRNLALAYFDKKKDFRSARICMERALSLKPDNARLLYELQQLLKNSGAAPEERFALYEKYPDLTIKRDDCYLDKVALYTLKEDYSTAIDMTMKRTFHIYEGGEGKLTRLHAWMHVLYGNKLVSEGNTAEAEKVYRAGLIIPRKYGEAKSYFAQESHIYYFLGQFLENMGRKSEAYNAYEEAGVYKAAVSEISVFRALALQKLSKFSEARRVLDEMLTHAEDTLKNADRYYYFGVGAPTPMPFEYDIVKINTVDGNILKAYALMGFGRILEAKKVINKARELDPYEFRIHVFDLLSGLI